MTNTTTHKPASALRIGDFVPSQGFVSCVQDSIREPGKLIVAFMLNGASWAIVLAPADVVAVRS